MRKIGVLTSGGDSPGMNAAVMTVARSAALYGIPLIGIKRGYNGLLRKSENIKDDRLLSTPPPPDQSCDGCSSCICPL